MSDFLSSWSNAAVTSVGFFWMAFWAFALGYIISSGIQVFVTRERMQQAMGEAGPQSVGLATFFGFISSSCSFAALATSKSLYKKGAGLVPSLAFMLASTNLVIELGILIAVFLSWQFVVGEYVGGILLILCMWLIVKTTLPKKLDEQARDIVGSEEREGKVPDWKELASSLKGWKRVARRYFMEWGMVWRDVTFGFTVAGVISAFVPEAFFKSLFIGAGGDSDPTFGQLVQHTLVGPVAAFFTFIGSMGNIPLASLLYAHGVSFAGIMAFIFSDLVVFPVLRINAQYFGWKMAFYILAVFLVSLVASALMLHYGFAVFGMLPERSGSAANVNPSERFQVDYTLFLNIAFATVTGFLLWLKSRDSSEDRDEDTSGDKNHDHDEHDHDEHDDSESDTSWPDRLLTGVAYLSFVWLAGGVIISLFQ